MPRRSKDHRTRRGQGKIGKVMTEYKHGALRSSLGAKVRKQAVAIALSEA